MREQDWLDKVEHLSSKWKNRCDSIHPTSDKYRLSRTIWDGIWIFSEWDFRILRYCMESNRNWMVFEAHQRLKVEGIIRGFWVEECARDGEIESLLTVDSDSTDVSKLRMVMRKGFPSISKMVKELKHKDVSWIKRNPEGLIRLFEMGNETSHMSVRLMLVPHVERNILQEIRHCVYEVSLCALRISMISWDKSHVEAIENECMETLTQLEHWFRKVFVITDAYGRACGP